MTRGLVHRASVVVHETPLHTDTFDQNSLHPAPGISKEAKMHDKFESVCAVIQPDLIKVEKNVFSRFVSTFFTSGQCISNTNFNFTCNFRRACSFQNLVGKSVYCGPNLPPMPIAHIRAWISFEDPYYSWGWMYSGVQIHYKIWKYERNLVQK